MLSAPDGWPLWTSEVRPGREHDTTTLRAHAEVLPALAEAGGQLATLGDLGYEGERDTIMVAFKTPKADRLADEQKAFNTAHNRHWLPPPAFLYR